MEKNKLKLDLLTEQQICDELGVNRVTLWRWRKSETNPLKIIKIKGVVRYSMSEFLKWLEVEALEPDVSHDDSQ